MRERKRGDRRRGKMRGEVIGERWGWVRGREEGSGETEVGRCGGRGSTSGEKARVDEGGETKAVGIKSNQSNQKLYLQLFSSSYNTHLYQIFTYIAL